MKDKQVFPTSVGIADIGYFDNMLHADPKIREAKKQFMLRVFDAAVLLGVPAVCGFVGGLDDTNDRFRSWHGLWHVLNQLATFFAFKVFAGSNCFRSNPAGPAKEIPAPGNSFGRK